MKKFSFTGIVATGICLVATIVYTQKQMMQYAFGLGCLSIIFAVITVYLIKNEKN